MQDLNLLPEGLCAEVGLRTGVIPPVLLVEMCGLPWYARAWSLLSIPRRTASSQYTDRWFTEVCQYLPSNTECQSLRSSLIEVCEENKVKFIYSWEGLLCINNCADNLRQYVYCSQHAAPPPSPIIPPEGEDVTRARQIVFYFSNVERFRYKMCPLLFHFWQLSEGGDKMTSRQ